MKRRATSIALAAALLLGAVAATPASAEPWTFSQRVSYAGLDLNSDAGARAMLYRIHNAAASVCGDRPGLRPLNERATVNACMADASDRAVADLGSSNVTAMYFQRQPSVIFADAGR